MNREEAVETVKKSLAVWEKYGVTRPEEKEALSLLISSREHAERKVMPSLPSDEEVGAAALRYGDADAKKGQLSSKYSAEDFLIGARWAIENIKKAPHITLPDAETAAKKYTEIREEVLGELRASNRGKEMINKVMITDEELDKESMRRYHQWLEQGGKG